MRDSLDRQGYVKRVGRQCEGGRGDEIKKRPCVAS
jgi:hypothetical protein